MKLRNRLLTAFLIIILVPVLLFCVVLVGLNNYQARALERTYGVEDVQDMIYGTSIQFFDSMTEAIQEKLEQEVKEDPDQFMDSIVLEQWNQELEGRHSYLVVRKGGQIIYSGVDSMPVKLIEQLPAYGEASRFSDGGIYTGSEAAGFPVFGRFGGISLYRDAHEHRFAGSSDHDGGDVYCGGNYTAVYCGNSDYLDLPFDCSAADSAAESNQGD